MIQRALYSVIVSLLSQEWLSAGPPPVWGFGILFSPAKHEASKTQNHNSFLWALTAVGKASRSIDNENDTILSFTDSSSGWEEEDSHAGAEDLGQGLVSSADEEPDDDAGEEDPLLEEYTQWCQAVDKTRESLAKKETSLTNEMKKASAVEDTMYRAQLLTNNMYLFTPGVKSAIVTDWEKNQEVEITLGESFDSASAEADALYQQARKLKRGSTVVQELLGETSEALECLEEMENDLKAVLRASGTGHVNDSMFRLVQDKLIRSSRMTGFSPPVASNSETKQMSSKNHNHKNKVNKKPALGTPASNVRKLTSPGGCIVLVGRNRRGNEHLTFSVARGNDVWMHSRGCPGAHVLIQQRRGSPPATDACLQFAADLAIFYSDARSERSFDVTSAEPKHLLKPRGAPLGAVKLREESKVYTGYPGEVAEDLKQAREESGQEDAYRFNDKAKHRRRTREAAKQEQDKKRSRIKERRKARSKK